MAKKEQLIDLLEEKRASVLNNYVTGQMTTEVRMKPSGLVGLERIPDQWSVERLKWSVSAVEQGWSPQCENRPASPDEWGVLKVGCVNGTSFVAEENKALPADIEPLRELEIKAGDLLMSRANTRELLGSVALAFDVRPKLLLCDKLYRLKVRETRILRAFLLFALRLPSSRFQMEREATGASGSMQNISQETIRNIWMAIPPSSDQDAIVRKLRDQLATIDAVLDRVRRAIERLKEYRTALISAAVTGKIDVREAPDSIG